MQSKHYNLWYIQNRLIKSASITTLLTNLLLFSFAVIFNICTEFIVNQQVKRPQPMIEVTGKFVLKCRTTNITTLFDISLFYVYKYFIFSASSTQNCKPTCRCSLIIYTKNHRGVWGRTAAIAIKPISITQNSSTRNGHLLKTCFKQYDY